MRKMELQLKNVVQMFVLIALIIRVKSTRVPGTRGISKIQEIPQYRFHYYVQDDKNIGEYKPSQEENKNGEKVGSYNIADSNGDIRIVNYRVDKSNGLQTDVNTNVGASPLKISLNNPVYNIQTDILKESTLSSEASPIVVEPLNTQEQKSSKPIEMDSRDEYNLAESTEKLTKLTELISTNQTEDRKDDVKDEQVTDQVLIQDEGITIKQTEFTIPFKKPSPVSTDDLKINDDEAIKKDIVKMIQNINGEHGQLDPQLNFKSALPDKPLKMVETDSIEMEQQESYQPSHGHSKFKSQQLSNKPLRLVGYNPSIFGSLYDTQVNYNRPSQIQQPPNLFNQGYFAGFGTRGDIKQQAYDNSGIYYSQPSSTSPQPGNYKGNKKSNLPTPTQPLYYYDPNSMVMLPVYTNMIQNDYSIAENKPQPPQPQTDSGKNGFNLMQILSGGSFYKGSEQAEGSQQMAVKDSIKPEYNKFEKSKPIEKHEKSKPLETHDKPKPLETQDKSKTPQTLMFYLNPGEPPIDLKSLTSSPMHLTFGQQPQSDCNGKTLKPPTVKSNKPLQPIPLCSDCVPALGFMGLPSTKSAVQQKKSIATPQVMPIWNGQTVSKLNYLILPTPITK
ncbi:uncharacterized protein LOC113553364 [Rhopalosiphum maidis]|uniref:uncharacterized protein LOC113553364 n=1 Tax=Rhopalosiphum maidis TaxID=43146 RepID=UPI000EFF29B6|nr:uncharacterized protein LOC113553364 [Rhopalosiphum maidis]